MSLVGQERLLSEVVSGSVRRRRVLVSVELHRWVLGWVLVQSYGPVRVTRLLWRESSMRVQWDRAVAEVEAWGAHLVELERRSVPLSGGFR